MRSCSFYNGSWQEPLARGSQANWTVEQQHPLVAFHRCGNILGVIMASLDKEIRQATCGSIGIYGIELSCAPSWY